MEAYKKSEAFKMEVMEGADFYETAKKYGKNSLLTDCRAYIEDPEDILSKPLKCGYNPYTGEWEKWSENKMKKKAISYFNLNTSI